MGDSGRRDSITSILFLIAVVGPWLAAVGFASIVIFHWFTVVMPKQKGDRLDGLIVLTCLFYSIWLTWLVLEVIP